MIKLTIIAQTQIDVSFDQFTISFGPGQSQRVETSHPAFFQTAKEGNQTRIREFKLAKTTLTVRVVLQVCTHEESDRSLAISIQKPNLGFVSFVCFVYKTYKTYKAYKT